jgi:hypothetical protein
MGVLDTIILSLCFVLAMFPHSNCYIHHMGSITRSPESVSSGRLNRNFATGRNFELGDNNEVPIIRTSIEEILAMKNREKFAAKSGFKDVNAEFNGENRASASIRGDGFFSSYEVYACHPASQTMVSSQIANWARAEIYALKSLGSYSAVFNSVCGRRVVHTVGWQLEGKRLQSSFDDFRKRGDSSDNPVALKESTHLYRPVFAIPDGAAVHFDSANVEKYPLFSIDIYNSKRPEKAAELSAALKAAVNAATREDGAVHIPDLRSMFVMQSPDNLACIVLGVWTDLYSYEGLKELPDYQAAIRKARDLAIEGTMSDILEKTPPTGRMYFISDILLP